MRLEPFEAWLDLPESGALLPQLQDALERRLGDGVEPLRWAITAVEPGLAGSCPLLTLEAVVLA